MHRRVLDEILAELRADPGVRGVLLSGSAARGTARADSDFDLLVVAAEEDCTSAWRSRTRPLPVDFLVHTADHWREHFSPSRVGDESWGYAFLDGVVLHDPESVVARRRADPVETGWAAAAMTNDLLRTAWAADNLPNPSLDLGTVQRHLDDLAVPDGVPSPIRAILRAAPKEALRRQLELITALEAHLGNP
ncbi:nucleotidyltransferase domain-containing protein [Amycolatopsis orientalis]|uniref:nucleotidyltransferase domain-containing protein n=1 Tax=Amycolatopsis orientalis TaxID=31958 RepID=UPI00190FAC70|nr:nucleotidyltransferase domain-containing protein [Amycolatopsis orientalis]